MQRPSENLDCAFLSMIARVHLSRGSVGPSFANFVSITASETCFYQKHVELQTSTNPCDTGTRCVRFLSTIMPITMTTKTAMQAMAMPRLDPLANDFAAFIPFIGSILM